MYSLSELNADVLDVDEGGDWCTLSSIPFNLQNGSQHREELKLRRDFSTDDGFLRISSSGCLEFQART
jgi:hypothetical protein